MRSLALAVVVSLSILPISALAQPEPPTPMVRQPSAPSYPVFPESERAKGVKLAVVKLDLVIDARGHVTQVTVKESAGPEFDASAIAAAKGTTFRPLEEKKKPKGKANDSEYQEPSMRNMLTTQPWEVKFELR